MSEITEADLNPATEFDPTTMRKTKPGMKRLTIILTVLLSFLLGLPFFLKSVEIYRSSLPFHEIDHFSKSIESNTLHFPCHFHAVFVNFDKISSSAAALSHSIELQILKLNAKRYLSCGACNENLTVSVTLESGLSCVSNDRDVNWKCGAVNGLEKGNDNSVDDDLKLVLEDRDSEGKVYTVVVVRREDMEEARVVVGKYRHAWIVGSVLEEEAVDKVAEIFMRVFMNGGNEEGSIRGEFMPVGADGKIVLSFNLLNADPRDWTYDWDFQEVDDSLLSPIIEALKPLANVQVESQVLYHTPKSSFSYWDDKLGSYIFSTKDLPFFVNSNEWHLDTSVAAGGRSKILQFVVMPISIRFNPDLVLSTGIGKPLWHDSIERYIPSASECPLTLQLPNGGISMTNGFVSPMWGSVVVWNPSSCSDESNVAPRSGRKISHEELKEILEVFIGQLRQLFGLKSNGIFGDASGKIQLLTSERGFTEWELDMLSRQHTCFNLHQCGTTLGSLSRLVQSLPRMIIKDEIGKQVKHSLEAAKLALTNVSAGVYEASAESSRLARSFAEDAFYHPSMMSVSYYSFEHCFAVYSPFFLPVSLHVLLAALREWKRYKQESRKYSTWKAKLE